MFCELLHRHLREDDLGRHALGGRLRRDPLEAVRGLGLVGLGEDVRNAFELIGLSVEARFQLHARYSLPFYAVIFGTKKQKSSEAAVSAVSELHRFGPSFAAFL